MDDDKMKAAWRNRNCDSSSGLINEANSKDIMDFRRETSLERLANRYKRFFMLGFCMIPLVPAWVLAGVLTGPYQIPMMIFGMLYFLLCGCMDVYLYNQVREINVFTMTTGEVIEKAAKCRKLHLRYIMILLPLAIFLIIGLALINIDNKTMVLGICFGCAVGLAIGIMQLSRFMDDYRAINRKI